MFPNRYYTLSLKLYPSGYITGSIAEYKPGYRYVQSLHNVKDEEHEYGGHWYSSTKWKFIETNAPGWYLFMNLKHSDLRLTYSSELRVSSSGYFLILDEAYSSANESRKEEYLVRPIYLREAGSSNQYRLTFKTMPASVVTWTNTHSSNDYKFLQVENGTAEFMESNYGPGQRWFDDSLIIFEDVGDASNCLAPSVRLVLIACVVHKLHRVLPII